MTVPVASFAQKLVPTQKTPFLHIKGFLIIFNKGFLLLVITVYCNECGDNISDKEASYSETRFNNFLCFQCQRKITPEERKLFEELSKNHIYCVLHKNDGHKTIDLVVPDVQLNIEVDGQQHSFDQKQAFSDLLRTSYSREKGWETIRIPNVLIQKNLSNTVNRIINHIEFLQDESEED